MDVRICARRREPRRQRRAARLCHLSCRLCQAPDFQAGRPCPDPEVDRSRSHTDSGLFHAFSMGFAKPQVRLIQPYHLPAARRRGASDSRRSSAAHPQQPLPTTSPRHTPSPTAAPPGDGRHHRPPPPSVSRRARRGRDHWPPSVDARAQHQHPICYKCFLLKFQCVCPSPSLSLD